VVKGIFTRSVARRRVTKVRNNPNCVAEGSFLKRGQRWNVELGQNVPWCQQGSKTLFKNCHTASRGVTRQNFDVRVNRAQSGICMTNVSMSRAVGCCGTRVDKHL
jgi:hypothetical protein